MVRSSIFGIEFEDAGLRRPSVRHAPERLRDLLGFAAIEFVYREVRGPWLARRSRQRLALRLQSVEPAALLELLAAVLLAVSGARSLVGDRLAGFAKLVSGGREFPLARKRDRPLGIGIVTGKNVLDRPTVDFR